MDRSTETDNSSCVITVEKIEIDLSSDPRQDGIHCCILEHSLILEVNKIIRDATQYET